MPSIDGLMNFHLRSIVLSLARGEISGRHAGAMIATMVEDAGVEPMLRSWLMLDNHDTQRLTTMLPDTDQRRIAQVLQFTLPGAPVIYYGSELGMTGGDDPEMRAPMRWDLIEDEDPDALAELEWVRSLVDLRRSSRALRIGDYRALHTERGLAFMRRTDRYAETVIVVCNPTPEPIREVVQIRDSKQMGSNPMIDLIGGSEHRVYSGVLDIEIPARSAMVLQARPIDPVRYTPHKRMQ
ncbi:MAG: alpha-amylase family glycosyl hydrolase, partial [Phycisphaerales bacterium]